jgi:hypothetical protein
VNVIRPKETSCPEYITLVKFDSCENLIRWKESPILAKWLEKLPDLLVGDSLTQERVGLELLFDRPGIPITQTVTQPDGTVFFFVRDPDGNVIEFHKPNSPNAERHLNLEAVLSKITGGNDELDQ